MLSNEEELVETGAKVVWELGVSNVALKVRAVAVDEDEAIVSDERGGLWYISDIDQATASPLNIVVWAGNGLRAYCPNSAYGWLGLTRGRLLLWNQMFPRDVLVCRPGEGRCDHQEQEIISKFDSGQPVRLAACHPAGIRCLSHDFQSLATGDSLGCVRLFGLFDKNGQTSITSAHTTSPVTAITIARSGIVVSGSDDGKVRVWSAINTELILQCELRPGSSSITCLACIRGQNEPLLAVGGNDGSLSLWSVAEASPRLIEVHDDTLEPLVTAISTTDNLLVLDASCSLRSYALEDTRLGLGSLSACAASVSLTSTGEVFCCEADKPRFFRLSDKNEGIQVVNATEDDQIIDMPPLLVDTAENDVSPPEHELTPEIAPYVERLDFTPEPRPPPKVEILEEAQAPRITPPTPSLKPLPPLPDPGARRECSTIAYSQPSAWDEDDDLAAYEERRAQEARRLALLAQEEARRADAALAEARRAATIGLAKPSLAPVDAKLPTRKRIVAKQVDKSWLQRRDKLRPKPQDFAIPSSSRCQAAPGRLRAPPLPLPTCSHDVSLIPTTILVL
mmetsp:Transcript_2662/g.3620  ORF Transcript_2662/g.3620 Transcript_2662/m.3620 type:complete len:565 (+) Transcript_2662:33-1727(+)